MAISRDKKQTLVNEMTALLEDSRMTVFAAYHGLSVADLQALRAKAREAGVSIKVIKNRLVRVAIQQTKALKDVDTASMKGQLLYATSSTDEVAPAQVLHRFAKEHEALQFVGAISREAKLLSVQDVTDLASLASKEQLIAETVAQLLSPVHDTVNGLSGNLHALLDGVEAKATA
jgi:large subunit ribosomal protein L10